MCLCRGRNHDAFDLGIVQEGRQVRNNGHTGRDLPGMLEVIEINAATEEAFHNIRKAAQEWNGKDFVVHRG